MELMAFTQTDGKEIYINPSLIAVIQEANGGTTFMWVSGTGFSIKGEVDKIRKDVNEALAKVK